MIRAAALALALLAGPAAAVTSVLEEDASLGLGAELKALDKINGQVSSFEMLAGGSVQIGKLVIRLKECRYPRDNPDGDAFAFLTISEPAKSETPIFEGWMIASSPALNALDHFRYDVWVLRCKTL
ncbi:DUF2155 domain-containing protein [Pseudooceanicola sp. 216_PA32_1]|uniref:DUF2155 domain-containing protein n=1 Tax=Pseudooceanicola pacificus TaxID=2676438 RepID=A0A844W1C9_9RHOB|nr:DUF2155 domain-containing protein [Pseudooceanicola pacificus]MWB77916.1 DUF2155 domain-containing protein [Pseudooceanicola pacificus]